MPENTPAAGYGEFIKSGDPVAAALEDMQKRWDVFGESDGMPLLLGALKAVLKLHTLTGYVCRMERCPQHRSFGWGWDVCRACPNCVLIEREGCCDRCRDENGDPARAEECKERQAISGKLLRASNSGEGSGG
jgi:hypothetical protein